MKTAITPRTRFGVTGAAILLLAALATAEDGRNFAGFYALGEPTDEGEEVSVTLTVRVHNYSGADVAGATIVLEDSLLPGEDLGSFTTIVDIRDRESARLSEPFTLPRRQYEQWQEGAPPRLRIEFTNLAGVKRRAAVELAPLLVEEGQ